MDIKCPHCGTSYEVEQEEIGQKALCEVCGRNFIVEVAKAEAPETPHTVPVPEKSTVAEKKPMKTARKKVIHKKTFCATCGAELNPAAVICPHCGVPVAGANQRTFANPNGVQYVNLKNYLLSSVLATLCCCFPVGIVAIVFAAQVNSRLARGDIEGAKEASRMALLFCNVAALAGLALVIMYMFVIRR